MGSATERPKFDSTGTIEYVYLHENPKEGLTVENMIRLEQIDPLNVRHKITDNTNPEQTKSETALAAGEGMVHGTPYIKNGQVVGYTDVYVELPTGPANWTPERKRALQSFYPAFNVWVNNRYNTKNAEVLKEKFGGFEAVLASRFDDAGMQNPSSPAAADSSEAIEQTYTQGLNDLLAKSFSSLITKGEYDDGSQNWDGGILSESTDEYKMNLAQGADGFYTLTIDCTPNSYSDYLNDAWEAGKWEIKFSINPETLNPEISSLTFKPDYKATANDWWPGGSGMQSSATGAFVLAGTGYAKNDLTVTNGGDSRVIGLGHLLVDGDQQSAVNMGAKQADEKLASIIDIALAKQVDALTIPATEGQPEQMQKPSGAQAAQMLLLTALSSKLRGNTEDEIKGVMLGSYQQLVQPPPPPPPPPSASSGGAGGGEMTPDQAVQQLMGQGMSKADAEAKVQQMIADQQSGK